MTRRVRRDRKPETLEEIVANIPRRYLEVLQSRGDGEYVYPMSHGASQLQMPYDLYRKMIRELWQRHLLNYGHLKEEDGDKCLGSGYWLSPLGQKVLSHFGLDYWG